VDLPTLDGFAGLAALVNGLILWPVVQSLKKEHGERIAALEQSRSGRPDKKARSARTIPRHPSSR
jgi:hypothetical protein